MIDVMQNKTLNNVPAFFQEFFHGGAKSNVMQISFVMLLFSDQISGRGKVSEGGANCLRGAPPLPPLWKKSSVNNITVFFV